MPSVPSPQSRSLPMRTNTGPTAAMAGRRFNATRKISAASKAGVVAVGVESAGSVRPVTVSFFPFIPCIPLIPVIVEL